MMAFTHYIFIVWSSPYELCVWRMLRCFELSFKQQTTVSL